MYPCLNKLYVKITVCVISILIFARPLPQNNYSKIGMLHISIEIKLAKYSNMEYKKQNRKMDQKRVNVVSHNWETAMCLDYE